VDARKVRLEQKDALAMLTDIEEIYVAKGKRVSHVDLSKENPGNDALLSLLLGPTGNLRAPTLRVGRTLLVGFDEATYQKMFR
jgi:arsenate reductase-like glutaredoxin family protein